MLQYIPSYGLNTIDLIFNRHQKRSLTNYLLYFLYLSKHNFGIDVPNSIIIVLFDETRYCVGVVWILSGWHIFLDDCQFSCLCSKQCLITEKAREVQTLLLNFNYNLIYNFSSCFYEKWIHVLHFLFCPLCSFKDFFYLIQERNDTT